MRHRFEVKITDLMRRRSVISCLTCDEVLGSIASREDWVDAQDILDLINGHQMERIEWHPTRSGVVRWDDPEMEALVGA